MTEQDVFKRWLNHSTQDMEIYPDMESDPIIFS